MMLWMCIYQNHCRQVESKYGIRYHRSMVSYLQEVPSNFRLAKRGDKKYECKKELRVRRKNNAVACYTIMLSRSIYLAIK